MNIGLHHTLQGIILWLNNIICRKMTTVWVPCQRFASNDHYTYFQYDDDIINRKIATVWVPCQRIASNDHYTYSQYNDDIINRNMATVWAPCQRIAQGHNGNSRPVRSFSWQLWWGGWLIIKSDDDFDVMISTCEMIFFDVMIDFDLWEWEVCGKVKAAKLREGTVDKGES